MIDLEAGHIASTLFADYGVRMSAVLAIWREASMTGAELRVLEARMDKLNAMLQDLVYQVRHIQAPGGADHRQQIVTDLSRGLCWACPTHLATSRSLSLGRLCSSEAAWRGHLDDRRHGSSSPGVQRSPAWSCPDVSMSRASSATVASIRSSRWLSSMYSGDRGRSGGNSTTVPCRL